ncbi:TPA: molybdate ABC transporter substrate-binding protein [Clostridium perfringens]|uniref:molybdate ABC transporter substrate-binding protein n=1 Tax=Clostridium perfringens TaxID=1502 RepID=UPI001009F817|nr:molybdate ABC transporter substrate-binding protein [Clostridium perfringens]EJT5938687.1 molybdate ABC transporter substrate-binding protein [Clostridium perfringens]EJT6470870.1 molybdate ABC transporter substrate-binding protein [Clostridium perfringens]MDG6878481.1 Molybdate-binding periplasmic protein precursor [Clostridium perfringens]NGT79130.1 molybdate ABC transporter substrate-binding protein [Clostridium perfringens]RXI82327.1 molybdate ABC transporter substrate-binding protein [
MRKKISLSIIMIIGMLSLLFVGCTNNKEEKTLTVSIAASLQKPMEKIAANFEKENGVKIQYNVGGSGTLKKQISDGADVDLFFSANTKYAKELIDEGLVNKDESYKILNNQLVLIENNDYNKPINSLEGLKNVEGKIAIGEISTVPAGQYAKESLEKVGDYKDIEDKLVFARSVTNVKTYVENGEANLGFVYKTDTLDLKNSKIVYEVPNDYHKPIEYELCLLKNSKNNKEAKKLIEYLKGEESKKIFSEYGFEVN